MKDNFNQNKENHLELTSNIGKFNIHGNKGIITPIIIIIICVVTIITNNWDSKLYEVQGNSMEPTLHNGQIIKGSRILSKLTKPQRGDIVVINSEKTNGEYFVKRIVALPGDTVRINNNKVYVNNELLNEKYIKQKGNEKFTEHLWQVQDNEVFVLGDNRETNGSLDSRLFGSIKISELETKIKPTNIITTKAKERK